VDRSGPPPVCLDTAARVVWRELKGVMPVAILASCDLPAVTCYVKSSRSIAIPWLSCGKLVERSFRARRGRAPHCAGRHGGPHCPSRRLNQPARPQRTGRIPKPQASPRAELD
jgi:hypothetical protein